MRRSVCSSFFATFISARVPTITYDILCHSILVYRTYIPWASLAAPQSLSPSARLPQVPIHRISTCVCITYGDVSNSSDLFIESICHGLRLRRRTRYLLQGDCRKCPYIGYQHVFVLHSDVSNSSDLFIESICHGLRLRRRTRYLLQGDGRKCPYIGHLLQICTLDSYKAPSPDVASVVVKHSFSNALIELGSGLTRPCAATKCLQLTCR
jgi:hypothetical protein